MRIRHFIVPLNFLLLSVRVVANVFFCIFCKRRKSCLQVDCFIRTIQRPHDVIGVMVAATVLSGWYKIVNLALARNRIVCLFFFVFCACFVLFILVST